MEKRDLLKLMTAAGFGAVAANALPAAKTAQANAHNSMARVERILAENKIRAAYIVYPPFLEKDLVTGKLSGLCIEVADEMAKNIGITIDWVEEALFGNAAEGLISSRYDLVVANFWPNGKRARVADFVMPMFYSGLHVLARAGDARFTNLHDYGLLDNAGYSFSTIDGDVSSMVIAQMFPQAKAYSLPQSTSYSQQMENVATGKADLALIEATAASEYMKNNPGKLQNLSAAEPFQVYANCFLVNKGEDALRTMLSIATEEMLNTGMMDRILKKYESMGTELYRVANPYRAQA